MALWSCGDALAPADLTGSYDLARVNGTPPPGSVAAAEPSCAIGFEQGRVDIFTLDSRSWFVLQSWRRLTCPGFGGSGSEYDPLGLGGVFTLRGRTLLITVADTPADTLRLEATAFGDGLRVVLPEGFFGLAAPATLFFGPRRDLPLRSAP